MKKRTKEEMTAYQRLRRARLVTPLVNVTPSARNEAAQICTDFQAAMDSFAVFCDSWVWIEDKEHHGAIPLKLWPSQRAIIQQLTDDMLLILLKTRQVGLTWLCAALVLWLAIKNILHLTVIISYGETHAIEFMDRVYFILDRLPPWMIPTMSAHTRQVLEFKTGNLRSTIKSMPTIEMGAESKTPNLLIIDEAHTIRDVGSIYGASLPGIEQAKGRVVIIANSVRGGSGWGWIRDTYTASRDGKNTFKRIFLPWTAHPGRPTDFRERMIASGMDEIDVAEHYPANEAEALAAASGGYFGDTLARHKDFADGIRGHLQLVKGSKIEVEFLEDKHGPVRIWRYPYELVDGWDETYWTHKYAIGSDVSEGLGQTFSTGYVIDRTRDEFVAKIKSNRVDAVEWAEQLRLLALYYGDFRDVTQGRLFRVERLTSLICVEVTGSGQTTVKELIKKKANQYVRVVPDKVGSGLTKQYGWPESQTAKYEMAGDLKQYFKSTKGTIYDAELIDQASIFIRGENGRLGHEEGVNKFDDDVIGAGLTIQASVYLGGGPEKITPPLTGWQGRQEDASKRETVWAA